MLSRAITKADFLNFELKKLVTLKSQLVLTHQSRPDDFHLVGIDSSIDTVFGYFQKDQKLIRFSIDEVDKLKSFHFSPQTPYVRFRVQFEDNRVVVVDANGNPISVSKLAGCNLELDVPLVNGALYGA